MAGHIDENGNWVDDGTDPSNPNAGKPGYDLYGNKLPKSNFPPGWVLNPQTGRLIPPGTAPTAGAGIGFGELFAVGDTVYRFNGTSITKATVAETKSFWNNGGQAIDPSAPNGGASSTPYGGLGADFAAATANATPEELAALKWLAENGGGGGAPNVGAPTPGNAPTGRVSTGSSAQDTQVAYDRLNQQEQDRVDQLAYQYYNAGLDYDSARRSALASLISNRNNASINLAQASGDIAAKAAQFAANPRDAVADLMYRNAIGGSTPYGDTNNAAFGNLQSSLANKFQELFGGVAGDLSMARRNVAEPIPAEYLRQGVQPVAPPAPNFTPHTYASAAPATPAAAEDPWAAFRNRTPEEIAAFNAAYNPQGTPQLALGGKIDVSAGFPMNGGAAPSIPHNDFPFPSKMPLAPTVPATSAWQTRTRSFDPAQAQAFLSGLGRNYARPFGIRSWADAFPSAPAPKVAFTNGVNPGPRNDFPMPKMFAEGGTLGQIGEGYRPASSSGGTNMNIHELAFVVGKSGHVYATLGEHGYPEQLKIVPTKEGKEYAQALDKQKKEQMKSGDMAMKQFADGGAITSTPSTLDFVNQLRQTLGRLGGPGGGAGVGNDPLNLRLLAGAPDANMDPDLRQYLYSAESAQGISPETVDWTIKRFTPTSSQNNFPRVSFA